MKRLGICAFVAGLVVGQTFNGPVTEAIGIYMLALAALLAVSYALTSTVRGAAR